MNGMDAQSRELDLFYNEADQAMIWMDGLDLPLINDLDGIFFEPYADHKHPVAQGNGSERKYSGRQVNSSIYHVFEGSGHAVINGQR